MKRAGILPSRPSAQDQPSHALRTLFADYQYTCEIDGCISSTKYTGYTEDTVTERMRNRVKHGFTMNHLREAHHVIAMITT